MNYSISYNIETAKKITEEGKKELKKILESMPEINVAEIKENNE
jgi:hypothetical protein